MNRLCCGCYTSKDALDLMRIQIIDETVQAVQRKHPHSRSAWVCQQIDCIQTILKHPKRLLRSLGKKKKDSTQPKNTPEFNTTSLLTSIRRWLLHRIQQELYILHCSGLLEYYTIDRNTLIWRQHNTKLSKQNGDKVLKYWVYTNKEFAKSPKKEYATVENCTAFTYFPVVPTQHSSTSSTSFTCPPPTEEPKHTTVSDISNNTITLLHLPYENTSVCTRMYEEYSKANDSTNLYHVIGIMTQTVTSPIFTYIKIFEHLQGFSNHT